MKVYERETAMDSEHEIMNLGDGFELHRFINAGGTPYSAIYEVTKDDKYEYMSDVREEEGYMLEVFHRKRYILDGKLPRICEVLGVEPLREWTIRVCPKRIVYRINEYGVRQYLNEEGKWRRAFDEEWLRLVIEHPSLIQVRPCRTPQSEEDEEMEE